MKERSSERKTSTGFPVDPRQAQGVIVICRPSAPAVIGLREVWDFARKSERLARLAERRDRLVGRNVQAVVAAHPRKLSRLESQANGTETLYE